MLDSARTCTLTPVVPSRIELLQVDPRVTMQLVYSMLFNLRQSPRGRCRPFSMLRLSGRFGPEVHDSCAVVN
jgi:hypothetical protein